MVPHVFWVFSYRAFVDLSIRQGWRSALRPSRRSRVAKTWRGRLFEGDVDFDLAALDDRAPYACQSAAPALYSLAEVLFIFLVCAAVHEFQHMK